MRFEYVAKRNIASGHTLDDNYEIVIFGWVIDPSYDMVGPENESLDGSIERELLRIDTEYRVQTDALASGSAVLEFEEFLHSVAAGETFTFDPDSDTVATPVNPLTVKMKTRRFTRERISPGQFQFTFDMRVIA